MLWIILAIVTSYLIGSIPTAYIFGRLLKGIDIRQYGSGNVGATNALRVLGKTAGISVLLLDVLKGFLTIVVMGNILASKIPLVSPEIIQVISGLICVCGHNWTIFLGFKGGKGMAATLGVLLGLSIGIKGLSIILSLSVLIWLIVFLSFRIVSAASIISSVGLPVLTIILKQPPVIIILSFILSILVILRHRSNIKRILQGKESRLIFRKKK